MSDFFCHDLHKRGFCTCSGSFDGCACEPASTAGGETTCVHCREWMYHRNACGNCETFPCRCHPLALLAETLWSTAAMAWSPPLLPAHGGAS